MSDYQEKITSTSVNSTLQHELRFAGSVQVSVCRVSVVYLIVVHRYTFCDARRACY